jgi:uncharacterized protein
MRIAMPNPDFAAATDYARVRLERELSPLLIYHNVAHTRDDVAPAALELAQLEGVSAEETLLLVTAAWYHDLGYVDGREDHESVSVQIAGEALPGFGYTAEQVAAVQRLIGSTRLPTSPRNWLEGALADADLRHLGGPAFLERNARLRREVAAHGHEFGDAQWYADQLTFLRNHRYHTSIARRLWDAGKQENIALLERMLARCG